MFRIRHIITLCTSLFLAIGCTSTLEENETLQQAMRRVDTHSEAALTLLTNQVSPKSLDLDSYMHYVVTLTQARYMDYQDITGDTTILVAQRYFVEKQNLKMATKASFYTATYFREKHDDARAFEHYLLTNFYAQEANYDLFRAKSIYWIGNIYFNRDELDSAGYYYQQALNMYSSLPDSDLHQLGLFYMLGRTYLQQISLTRDWLWLTHYKTKNIIF